ncbi:MAG: hypothetical protein HOF95_02675 [Rhodospirillales bacterium]|nr:hypothetical protein [Rhodospirillales bacterium]
MGVIAYEMLTGQFPYGVKVSHIRTQKNLRRLNFKSTLGSKEPLPDWIEFAISKAVHLDVTKRYLASSEFLADLKHPSRDFVRRKNVPLMEKNPVGVWQCLCLFFALTTAILLLLKS